MFIPKKAWVVVVAGLPSKPVLLSPEAAVKAAVVRITGAVWQDPPTPVSAVAFGVLEIQETGQGRLRGPDEHEVAQLEEILPSA